MCPNCGESKPLTTPKSRTDSPADFCREVCRVRYEDGEGGFPPFRIFAADFEAMVKDLGEVVNAA